MKRKRYEHCYRDLMEPTVEQYIEMLNIMSEQGWQFLCRTEISLGDDYKTAKYGWRTLFRRRIK